MQSSRLRFRCVAESLDSAHVAGATWLVPTIEGSVHKRQGQEARERLGRCSLDRRSPDRSDNWDRKTSCFLAAVPPQHKALRCKDGDGTAAFYQYLGACTEETQGISNLERQDLLSGSKPLMRSLVDPCTKSYTLPTTSAEKDLSQPSPN